MKNNIHPELHDVVIRCACGAEYKVKSTAKDMRVEVCSACHPFYTGKQRVATTGGRVERFIKRYGYRQAEERGKSG